MDMVNQLGEFSPRLAKLSKQIKKYWATNHSETGEQFKRNLLQMCRSKVIMLMNLSIILLKISIRFYLLFSKLVHMLDLMLKAYYKQLIYTTD